MKKLILKILCLKLLILNLAVAASPIEVKCQLSAYHSIGNDSWRVGEGIDFKYSAIDGKIHLSFDIYKQTLIECNEYSCVPGKSFYNFSHTGVVPKIRPIKGIKIIQKLTAKKAMSITIDNNLNVGVCSPGDQVSFKIKTNLFNSRDAVTCDGLVPGKSFTKMGKVFLKKGINAKNSVVGEYVLICKSGIKLDDDSSRGALKWPFTPPTFSVPLGDDSSYSAER